MTTASHLRVALTAVLAGLTLAASAQVSSTRIDANVSALTASTDALHTAPANIDRSTTGHAAPVTLYVEDPQGNAFRLVHVEGTGWKYVAGWQASDGRFTSLLRKVTRRAPPPNQGSVVPPSAEPLTVFIDGPSGFTFVWTSEGAWEFVGKIAGRRS